MTQYPPFLGDQRTMRSPINAPDGTRPLPVRAHVANRLISNFLATGYSYHSAAGHTVWVIIAACIANNIGYSLNRIQDGSVTVGWSIIKELS